MSSSGVVEATQEGPPGRSWAARITGEQIRAARAIVRVEQPELARRAGISLETVKRLERIRGPVEAHARTLRALLVAFEALGVQLVSTEEALGVQVRPCACGSPGAPAERPAPPGPENAPRVA